MRAVDVALEQAHLARTQCPGVAELNKNLRLMGVEPPRYLTPTELSIAKEWFNGETQGEDHPDTGTGADAEDSGEQCSGAA